MWIYDQIKDGLRIWLCDFRRFGGYPRNIIYRTCGEWCAMYYVEYSFGDGAIIRKIVKDKDLVVWGISAEQLHSDAVLAENIHRPVYLIDLVRENNTIERNNIRTRKVENLFESKGVLSHDEIQLYAITNSEFFLGAGVIAREGVLEKLGELMGSNYYILPSSFHELIILPDNDHICSRDLEMLVEYANNTVVDEKDRLSYTVQYYNRETGRLGLEKRK